jgi:teichuronic acid biosynthesis glycosyltransferase TuaC
MVGDGTLKEDLLLQAKQLGIANSLVLVGKRPHHEIPLWMNAADLFCLPSIREGRPNVILEALACGTPVVASNVGSIPEMIQRVNGELPKRRIRKALPYKFSIVWSVHGIERPFEIPFARFTWEDSAELYMQAYLRAMGRGQSA